MRTLGNSVWNCYPEDGECGERALVSDTEDFYDVLEVSSIICDFFCWPVSAVDYTVMGLMDTIDSDYNYVVLNPTANDFTSVNETTSTGGTIPSGTNYGNQSD